MSFSVSQLSIFPGSLCLRWISCKQQVVVFLKIWQSVFLIVKSIDLSNWYIQTELYHLFISLWLSFSMIHSHFLSGFSGLFSLIPFLVSPLLEFPHSISILLVSSNSLLLTYIILLSDISRSLFFLTTQTRHWNYFILTTLTWVKVHIYHFICSIFFVTFQNTSLLGSFSFYLKYIL